MPTTGGGTPSGDGGRPRGAGHDAATDPGPLVVACVRVADQRPIVDPLTGEVHHDSWGLGLSAADAAAVEHTLRIAGAWAGRAVVVAAAPPGADAVLVELAALGAAVVRVDRTDEPRNLGSDERDLAGSLLAAVAPFGVPAVVVCGDRSADRGTGALPAFIAHHLGAAQALGLVGLQPADGHLLVERRLDGGWRERLRVSCPAVCSVEAAGVRLRRSALPAALAARETPVPVAAPTSDPPDGRVTVGAVAPFRPRTRVVPGPTASDPRLRLLALTGALDEHDPPTVVGPVGASEAADVLLAYLDRHGYLAGLPMEAGS